MKYIWCLSIALCACCSVAQADTASGDLLDEDFEGLALGPLVEETSGGNVPGTSIGYTKTGPSDWTINNDGVPLADGDEDPANNGGVEEFEGWSFVSLGSNVPNDDVIPSTPVYMAIGQGREDFTRASGIVAVADPDEYDDIGDPLGEGRPTYNTLLQTGYSNLDLTGIAAGTTLYLSFDSSFRGETGDEVGENQTAVVTIDYGFGFSGISEELLRYASDPADPAYAGALVHNGGTSDNPDTDAPYINEHVFLSFVVPALDPGSENAQLTFSLLGAMNDWWWAIDNIKVGTSFSRDIPEPSSLVLVALGLAGLAAVARRRAA